MKDPGIEYGEQHQLKTQTIQKDMKLGRIEKWKTKGNNKDPYI